MIMINEDGAAPYVSAAWRYTFTWPAFLAHYMVLRRALGRGLFLRSVTTSAN